MKMFIDTANVDHIREANDLGVICGVTTNPSLIAKEGRDFVEVVKEITTIVDGPISAEVISLDHEGMVKEARELVKIHKNIVIKIPMTLEGLKAVKILAAEGVKTNVTLIFSATQALMAARAGATYVSPFLGRVDDIGSVGMTLIEEIVDIFDIHGIETEIIAASIRNPLHVIDAARAGCHIATIPYNVLIQMAKHPLTDIGIERFLKDWESVPKNKAVLKRRRKIEALEENQMNNMDNLTISIFWQFSGGRGYPKAKAVTPVCPWCGTCGIYPVGKGLKSKPCKPQLG